MASIFFPPKTIKIMNQLCISESTVLDVFHHGSAMKGKDGTVKKYSGYEIGLFYARDKITGQYVITYVWKRERR